MTDERRALADARNLMAQELEAGCSLHTLRKTWNEVEAALAALPPAGWRDISTAPKDGRQIVVRYKNKDGEDRYTIVRWKEGEWRIGSFNGGKQIFVLAHQYQPNAWCELILPTAALPPAPQRTGE